MAMLPTRGVRHLRRFRQIAQVFIRHGFGELMETLELLPRHALSRRLLRRLRPTAPRLGAPRRLRMALEELGPTFVKLGQVLSTRPDLLPPAFITELAHLRDDVPPGPWEPVRAQIEEELGGPLEEFFSAFAPEPLAAASLAQVHPAILLDGTPVVVKVQRPGIQRTIETDLEILSDIARLLQNRTPLGELYDLLGVVEEFAATLRAELDFYREGHNADRFRANFADEPYLYIPKVYWDHTTRRVLVLERIHGIRIDDVEGMDEAGYDRYRVALHATRMIVKEVLEDGFFHADPHPGNFVVMDDEVIGAMDFGMVGYLSRRDRADLVRLYINIVQLDEEGIVDQLIQMGMVGGQVDRAALRRDIGRLLRRYQGLPLKAIRAGEALQEAMPIAFRHHLRLPSELWLLGKTLAMMEGVGLQLCPDFDPFAVSAPYVHQFILQMASPKEWGPTLLRAISEWNALMALFPRVGIRLLTQAERGELEVTLWHKELGDALARIDRLANRISLSLLLAALIVGLALLVPAFRLTERGGLVTGLVIAGFVGASLLGIWLILSILRAGRR
ncbi:MAG TPA: AarF/ABC1/UbiB kinase family protein [Anaerolineales bacterium]|nr:AarF/ABC1/UbiB kinase family protein [Anaerolineae bacterium]HIQ00820.1 AarF/ABC1/UbiB kinase family protein [Anaerolineales bacterium]